MYINNNTNKITGCHYLMGSFVGPGIIKKKTPGDSELSWDSVIGFFILFYFCEMKIKVFNMRLVSKIVILSCE